MSRTSAWVIREQEEEYLRWLDERERRDAEVFGHFIPTADPETHPGHDYATDRESREPTEATSVPAVAAQNNPEEVP